MNIKGVDELVALNSSTGRIINLYYAALKNSNFNFDEDRFCNKILKSITYYEDESFESIFSEVFADIPITKLEAITSFSTENDDREIYLRSSLLNRPFCSIVRILFHEITHWLFNIHNERETEMMTIMLLLFANQEEYAKYVYETNQNAESIADLYSSPFIIDVGFDVLQARCNKI